MSDTILLQAFAWYAALALIGLLALPLAARTFNSLPDLGFGFARPLGLVIVGYCYWLLTTLGVLQNDLSGVLFALLVLALLSAWAQWKGGLSWIAQLRSQGRLVLAMEGLFLAAFVFWTIVRAAGPEASGTEKPMELAFIQAILRSPQFPPADPWLSGYAISYYYFGYVMVAMLSRLAGVSGAVGFNLGAASWFAMTALAAYALLYALLERNPFQKTKEHLPRPARRARLAALLAPLFLLLVSNGGGVLEVLHSGGVFWSNGQSGFWRWLNIQELVNPPSPPYAWAPERPGGIWWWRASRVVSDYGLDGGFREVIDEFPLFSYLLGDLHPHVLAMPFALLAAALALNTYRRFRTDPTPHPFRQLRSANFWLTALLLGALSFLNTWDWPMYLVLFGAAVALAGVDRRGWQWEAAADFFRTVAALGLAGGLLYLPFFLSFASQAAGLMPSLVYFTRGAHLWIMFLPLLVPIFAWLLTRSPGSAGRGRDIWRGLLISAALLLGLFLFMLLMGLLTLRGEPGLAGLYGASSISQLFMETFRRRLVAPGAWITLWLLLALLAARLRQLPKLPAAGNGTGSERFVLLMVLIGAGLVVFPEFFYLRDGFGTRMNTIFKFYFQSWVLWSVAAGYASVVALERLAGARRWLFQAVWVVLLLISLPYGFFWISSRLEVGAAIGLSLNGSALSAPEQEAVNWLSQAPEGVIVEAVGGSYTGFARIATHTGLPGVLGWPGHEVQWRGGGEEMGSRQQDIEQLYRARTWEEAQTVIDLYNIRYIVIGGLERSTYRPDEDLFRSNLITGFENSQVTILIVPHSTLAQDQAGLP